MKFLNWSLRFLPYLVSAWSEVSASCSLCACCLLGLSVSLLLNPLFRPIKKKNQGLMPVLPVVVVAVSSFVFVVLLLSFCLSVCFQFVRIKG